LAARIVDKASSEEIYVSEIVRGICAGKDFKFSNQGGFDMKGFDDPITLFEVLWEASETQEADPAPQGETEKAAAPAATPAKPKQEAPEVKAPSPAQKPATAVPTGATAKPNPVTQPAQPEVPVATPPAVPASGAPVQETTKQEA
jgi:hypothetical protein